MLPKLKKRLIQQVSAILSIFSFSAGHHHGQSIQLDNIQFKANGYLISLYVYGVVYIVTIFGVSNDGFVGGTSSNAGTLREPHDLYCPQIP